MAGFTINHSAIAKFKRRSYAELDRRILLFMNYLQAYIKTLISVETAIHGPSIEGAPPHLDTGALFESIMVTRYEDGYAVGSDVPYAIRLELGLSHIGPRPFLRQSLFANIDVLQMAVN